jgi:uncharacterized membrane protein
MIGSTGLHPGESVLSECPHCGASDHGEAKFCTVTGDPIPAVNDVRTVVELNPLGAQPPAGRDTVDEVSDDETATSDSSSSTDEPDPVTEVSSRPRTLSDLYDETTTIWAKRWLNLALTAGLLLVPVQLLSQAMITTAQPGPAAIANTAKIKIATAQLTGLTKELEKGEITHEKYRQDVAKYSEVLKAESGHSSGRSFLGSLLVLVLLLLQVGLVWPLTQGAVTISVARELSGRDTEPVDAWRMVVDRAPAVLLTGAMAGVLITIGMWLFVVPGVVVLFLFSMAMPVVIIEKLEGVDALKRSVYLVIESWVMVVLVSAVVGGVGAIVMYAVSYLSGIYIVGAVIHAVAIAALLPAAIIVLLLVYFEARKELDGQTDRQIEAQVARAVQ